MIGYKNTTSGGISIMQLIKIPENNEKWYPSDEPHYVPIAADLGEYLVNKSNKWNHHKLFFNFTIVYNLSHILKQQQILSLIWVF